MNIFYYFTVLVCLCLAYVMAVPAAVPAADDLEPAEARWHGGGGNHGGSGYHHGGGGGHNYHGGGGGGYHNNNWHHKNHGHHG